MFRNFFKSRIGEATAKESYNQGIKWKREVHRKNSTVLIETYSYEFNEGTLFRNLETKLREKGVKLLSPEEMMEIVEVEIPQKQIIKLFCTFLSLMKSNGYKTCDLRAVAESHILRGYFVSFINIFEPVYEYYQNLLKVSGKIDFSDMLITAAEYVRKNQYKSPFRYILIDEYQDISKGRYSLIKALQEQIPDTRIFAVGDDWQSIYKFTGSDLFLFTKYSDYFGYTRTVYLDKTYRFGSRLSEISEKFIMKNPQQLRKKLSTEIQSQENPVKLSVSGSVEDCLEELAKAEKKKSLSTVFILGRYSFDKPADINEISAKYYARGLDVSFYTVHTSKGLEADYVIINNLNCGKYGFPSEIEDDPVLNLVLSEAESCRNSEERRLFYVALTRARSMVYLVCDRSRISGFAIEIAEDTKEYRVCPECRNGILQKIYSKKTGKEFLGCSSFTDKLAPCKYTESI